MAFLQKTWIKSELLTFQISISVTKEGMFTCTLPPDIAKKVEEAGIELYKNRLGNHGLFEDTSLKSLCEQLKEVADKFSERKEVSKTLVLKYLIQTKCSYCKTKDGTIVPDGRWAEEKDGDYQWSGGTKSLDSCNQDLFGFEVYLEPALKVVWEFPDKTQKIEYEKVPDEMIVEHSTLHWLNSIRSLDFPRYGGVASKEIIYSEEAGLFFKGIFMYIFNMNEKLQGVFGEKLDLQAAIDSKKLLNFKP